MINVDELDKVVERLNEIEKVFGISGVIASILIIIGFIIIWIFFKKRIELVAEEASKKSLKSFQSQLDKELIKFSSKHQKQIDVVHEVYQKFERMSSIVNYILKGEKYTQQLKPQDELTFLIKYRHEFKDIFKQNSIIFPEQLCSQIDTLILSIDEFISIYEGGIFPEQSEEEKQFNAEQNNGVYLAGLWSTDAFDEILKRLDEISKQIELEFRKIYGTDK